MSQSEHLQTMIDQQKTLLKSLENEILRISKSDLTLENENLKKEISQLQSSLEEHQSKLKQTSFRNTELKNALYDQIYSEKLQIVNQVQKKNEIYFRSSITEEENHLVRLQSNLLQRVERLKKQLSEYRTEKSNEFDQQLTLITQQISEMITEAKEKMVAESADFSHSHSEQIEQLKNEQITDEMIQEIGKKNNLEALVGGNIANKLGIFFVILGIIAVSRYTMYKLPDTFKGLIMFAISGALLFAGEYLNRKKPSMFSLGITSSGVAGLYVSIATSYFGLQILSSYMAIFLCILITAGAFSLAKRYDSQTIAAFALIGGYLPLYSITGDPVLLYGAMIYFIMLNLLALSFSFYKKWKITMFIGFFLNLVSTIFITLSMHSFYHLYMDFGIHHITTLAYVLFAFGVYTFIPIISNYRTQQKFSKADVILLGLNTFLSSCMMFALFYMFRLEDYHGILTLFLAIIYVGLARFISTHFANEQKILALFYLTGLSFVILVIPFQFGKKWLSLGWLAQGTFLSVYGIYKKEGTFKKSGFLIFGLCVAAFLFFDVVTALSYRDRLFSYKYFAVTLGSLLILGALVKNHLILSKSEMLYKYLTLFNVWLFALAINYRTFNKVIRPQWPGSVYIYNLDFLESAAAIVLTFLVAYGLLRIPAIIDRGVQIISLGIATFGLSHLLVLLSTSSLIYHQPNYGEIPFSVWIISTLILVGLMTIGMIAIYQVMMHFSLKKNLPIEWFPLGVSAYFLIILTQTLIHQYDLSFTSIVISLIYLFSAIGFIYYGFTQRYSLIRRFGLGLAILAVFKLFLIDLRNLTQGYQIISYFSFGAVLLGISYIYQYFTKRLLHKEEEEIVNDEEMAS